MKLDGNKSLIGACILVGGALLGAVLTLAFPDSTAGRDLQQTLTTVGLGILGYGVADKLRKLTNEVKA